MKNRYFVDERGGCAAVRDRNHPSFDPGYPGLHSYTPDVVEYRHGSENLVGDAIWYMGCKDIEELNTICTELNKKKG